MKLINILITLVVSVGFASVHAQHHVPTPATSNANINGGIKSPTNGNIDIEGVATIIDKANDTERKLHDMLTSVKDVMDEKFGLDLIDALGLGGNGRRLSSKTNKSGKAIIDGVDDLLKALVAVIVLLFAEFFGLGGGGGGGGGITTTTSATTTGTTSATTTASTCPTVPGSVAEGGPCCETADCDITLTPQCQVRVCSVPNPNQLGSIDCSTPCTDTTDCTGAGMGEVCTTLAIDFCSLGLGTCVST